MNRLIRYRILTIVLLGVITSALSVAALVQLLTTSTANRVERARDAITDEVDLIARSPRSAAVLTDPTPSGIIGMRGGIWMGDAPPAIVQPSMVPIARTAVARARAAHDRVIEEQATDEGTEVVAARPVTAPSEAGLSTDSVAVVSYIVRPLSSLRTWRLIVALLAAVTAILVATSVYTIMSMNRGAAAIRSSLAALATDLAAPVARPRVRELDAIADGIAELARKLAAARAQEERLAQELGQNERLAALGRVAAGVAHEVRNPLASIKLRLDLASSTSLALPVAASKAIAHATSEIDRLDRLVADLLVVAGRNVGPKDSADLGAVVLARVEGLAPWAKERGIDVTSSGHGPALVDSDTMARAVDNLLRNAVEASPKGSPVVARVDRQRDRVVLRVEDEGPGVDESRVIELFEPFFTTKPAGTGLGLAITRAIVRAHGGDLVYAREGGKTCFSLWVPAVPADDARKEKEQKAA